MHIHIPNLKFYKLKETLRPLFKHMLFEPRALNYEEGIIEAIEFWWKLTYDKKEELWVFHVVKSPDFSDCSIVAQQNMSNMRTPLILLITPTSPSRRWVACLENTQSKEDTVNKWK